MPTLYRRIRKHERTFFYAITAVIAVSFFFWGASDFTDPQAKQQIGAIAGKPVTKDELDAVEYRVDLLILLDAFSRSPWLSMPFMRSRWLNQLLQARLGLRDAAGRFQVQQSLGLSDLGDLTQTSVRQDLAWKWLAYLRAAQAAGLTVTPDELDRFIRTITGLSEPRSPGATAPPPFPADQYQRLVQSEAGFHMPVAHFEKALADFLLAEKYFDLIAEAADVSPQELLDGYLDEAREVVVAWIGFKPSDFADDRQNLSREAIARRFQSSKGQFRIPDKAQIEYLLAEDDKYIDQVEAPSPAAVRTYYDGRVKEGDYKNPDGGKDGKPATKPIEEVREEIVKELRAQNASLKALDVMQKALLEIGALEAKQKQDPSVPLDFAALAARFVVSHGTTHFFSESDVEDAEKRFGEFRDPLNRQAFQQKVFHGMKDGEVMKGEFRPLGTKKGALIYRLVRLKPARVPDQLTAEAEAEIARTLAREARDKRAMDEAQRVVSRVNAVGLARAEAELKITLHRSPSIKPQMPLPDPSGEKGNHPDGGVIVERAHEMRKRNQIGKAEFLTGSSQTQYAVVLVQVLEASMDNFDTEKKWIRDRLMRNGWDKGRITPGKRQKLIDARRAEIEKGIDRKKPDSDAPEGQPAPPSKAPMRKR